MPRPVKSGASTAVIVLVVIFGVMGVMAVVGILAAIAIPNLLSATERSKQKRTMADMRSIASALEAYAIAHNRYPEGSTVADLQAPLSPTYLTNVPASDGWGNPIRYRCSNEKGPCSGYELTSGGRDKAFEENVDTLSPLGTRNFDCDIIYANGDFMRYPAELQTTK